MKPSNTPLVKAPVSENAEVTTLSTPPSWSIASVTIASHSPRSLLKTASQPVSRPKSVTSSLTAWNAAAIPWNRADTDSAICPETMKPTPVKIAPTINNDMIRQTNLRLFTTTTLVDLGKYTLSRRPMMRLSRYATIAPAKNGSKALATVDNSVRKSANRAMNRTASVMRRTTYAIRRLVHPSLSVTSTSSS